MVEGARNFVQERLWPPPTYNFKYPLQPLCRSNEDCGKQLQCHEVVWSCSGKDKLILKFDIYYIMLDMALIPGFNIDVFVFLRMYPTWRRLLLRNLYFQLTVVTN
jgi:hypothetical protein